MLDVLIENARIVDGTGAPWYRGAVGIADGRIRRVSREADHGLSADVEVDIEDRVLCPGFVDVHSHSGLRVFEEPTQPPKTRQCVTTEIVGQDGLSPAPIHVEDGAAEWQQHVSGLDGSIDLDWWTWGSTGEYLDALDDREIVPNVGMLVGHGNVRYNVLGMADAEPTDADIEEMANLVSQSLEDGAVGFSTGLIYPPQVHAGTEEVRRLAARLGSYGRPFFAHIRNQGRWIWESLAEFIEIGAQEDIPLHYSHLGMYGNRYNHGQADRALTHLETARDRGIDITADHHFFTKSSTMLQVVLPPWMLAFDPDERIEKLQKPEVRERIARDIEEWRIKWWENHAIRAGWENITITSVKTDENKDVEGKNVRELANERDEYPVDVVCDLLVEEELEVSQVVTSLDPDDLETVLTHERVAIASDALLGAKPHPRTYGAYPRVLGQSVREDHLLTVEEAVRKMTSLPARVVDLERKGVVRPGMDADLVVFEPDLVSSPATYDHPEQFPTGIPHVLVDGQFVVRDGEITDNRPGTAIRA